MTTTTEPTAVPNQVSDHLQCEATRACADHGEYRCPNLAAVRITVICEEPGCTHGALVVLACERCTLEFERAYGAAQVIRRAL